MKETRIHHILLVLIIVGGLSGLMSLRVTAQTPDDLAKKAAAWQRQAADAYVFPVQPGTREWSALSKAHTVDAALQIPAERLTTMSTAGLVETCVNYPLLGMTAYDSYPRALDAMIQQFNGLRELIQRPDAGVTLLTKYATMEPYFDEKFQGRNRYPREEFVLIETLLAYDAMLAGMPLSSRQTLLRESLRVFRVKTRLRAYQYDTDVPAVVMAKTLASLDYAPFRRQILEIPTQSKQYHDLLQYGGGIVKPYSTELLTAIIRNTEDYLTTITREGGQP